jgi:hypothetical protein
MKGNKFFILFVCRIFTLDRSIRAVINILNVINAVDIESYNEKFDSIQVLLFISKINKGIDMLIVAHNCHHIEDVFRKNGIIVIIIIKMLIFSIY